jgi:hypothetical protein
MTAPPTNAQAKTESSTIGTQAPPELAKSRTTDIKK